MHKVFLAVAFSVLSARTLPSQQETAVMTPIRQFLDAFNKGDIKAANADCSDITTILDEFAPYEWHGAGTCMTWMSAYDADAKRKGITEPVVAFGKPRYVDITGDHAYVVLPADYKFLEKGKPVHEAASTITITLEKRANGWRMTAWAWSKE